MVKEIILNWDHLIFFEFLNHLYDGSTSAEYSKTIFKKKLIFHYGMNPWKNRKKSSYIISDVMKDDNHPDKNDSIIKRKVILWKKWLN
jgi:hypothetical protein